MLGEAGDRQGRGVGAEDGLGTDGGLDLGDDLGLDLGILEHGLDDQVAALQRGVVGGRGDAAEQRVAVGGLGAALHDLVGDQLVRIGLALVGGLLVAVDQHDLEAGLRGDIGDAGAHEAGADDADLLQLARRHIGRAARALVELLHRDEERADHRGRLLRPQDLGEIAALDLEARDRSAAAAPHRPRDRMARAAG